MFEDTKTPEPAAEHTTLQSQWQALVASLDKRERQLSLARLLLFVSGAVALGNGLWSNDLNWSLPGACLLLGFAVAVVLHSVVLRDRERAQTRADVHTRHLHRLGNGWHELTESQADPYSSGHPYSLDLDLAGPGSLIARIGVCHTDRGFETLAAYLGAASEPSTVRARQAAVQELAELKDFRYAFEAAALEGVRTQRAQSGQRTKPLSSDMLSGESFSHFAQLPSLFQEKPWLTALIFALPPITIGSFVLGYLGVLPANAGMLALMLQILLTSRCEKAIQRAFNLASARQCVVEAFEQMLRKAEEQHFESPLLQELSQRLKVDEHKPSTLMARLRKWVSLGELRQQFLVWIFLNYILLWDLHVLRGMEHWNRQAGKHVTDWFKALGELEALCTLATFHALEPESTFPEVAGADCPLYFEALGHPLLPASSRVRNDVALKGLGTALIITGSNMAGKSTLLRAVGLNMALALAGGPVLARQARVPYLRIRASMRAQDNLQEGSSYFRAELNKLKTVVDGATAEPPLFFLLDELLRGTNERARHVGAKAVLLHLLSRRGCGLVATHDFDLAALESEDPKRIQNAHFTDTMLAGEMHFDYLLRPGIVKTSNALRLLALAGIDVSPEAHAELEAHTPSEPGPAGNEPSPSSTPLT